MTHRNFGLTHYRRRPVLSIAGEWLFVAACGGLIGFCLAIGMVGYGVTH